MRQAGRYLPEYRAVRASHDFLAICKSPELSAEVTVQPIDIVGVDAAIIFSDILLLPEAMGMNLVVEEGKGGPRFTNPIKTTNEVTAIHDVDCGSDLRFLTDAIRIAVERLESRVPLIGFCGSPWTLLAYMVEGRGGDFVRARAMLYNDPAAAHRLLESLARNCVSFLQMQAEAGADLVQIFDTWAGILPPHLYEEFSLRYIRQIVEALHRDLPVIVFSKGANASLDKIGALGASAVGVDWTISMGEAAKRIGGVIQGNLDPAVLLSGSKAVTVEAKRILESVPRGRHIFNLGHGILPNTPVDSVKGLVDFVKSWRVD
jgi:uroporphyrinogen decarboxylase